MDWLLDTIWWENSTLGRGFVGVIVLATAWALLGAHRNLARYRREKANLERLAHSLRTWEREEAGPTVSERLRQTRTDHSERIQSDDDADESGDSAESAPDPSVDHLVDTIDLEELKARLDPGSLAYHRCESIHRLRQRHVRVNLDTLHQLSLSRDRANPGQARAGFVAGLAILIGVLGTFVGLGVMLSELLPLLRVPESGTLDVAQITETLRGLRLAMAGMETAFSTSLVGLACGVLCSVHDFVLQRHQTDFFERFERLTAEELLPNAVPAVDDENLLERVSNQLHQSIGWLEDTFQQNSRAVASMTAVESSFSETINALRQITTVESDRDDMGRVIKQLEETNRSIVRLVGRMPEIAKQVSDSSHRGIDRIERMIRPILTGVGLFFVLMLISMVRSW